MKKQIPNIITSTRILGVLVVPFTFYLVSKGLAVILFMVSAITDGLDGYLARKWNATSELGRKLDASADKLLSAVGLGIVISITPVAIINLLLEMFIGSINLYAYYKKYNPYTLKIGKIKTGLLFSTTCLGILSVLLPSLIPYSVYLLEITAFLQTITLGAYIKNLNDKYKREKDKIKLVNQKENNNNNKELKEKEKIKNIDKIMWLKRKKEILLKDIKVSDIMIEEKIKLLPNKPGCYLMKNKDGDIIYVGKAKNLKNRVSSYFTGKHTGKTKVLINNINDFEYIVTYSEVEALILELNFIKRYNPKYNILLRDDKSYPYIELTNEKYPRLFIVRNPVKKNKGSKLFGPYPNIYAAKKTINMLNRMYPLRKCNHFNSKPCLYYYIGECKGYCVNEVSKEEIDNMVNDITRFLKGNDDILIKRIENKMHEAALNLDYEKAQEMKLLLDNINTILKNQSMDLINNIDCDIFGFIEKKELIAIQVFHLRGGKLVERDSSIFSIVDNVKEDLTYYICSFYDEHNLKPKEILIPKELDALLIEKILGIKVLIPQKGKKKKLVDMACKNAAIALNEKFEIIKRDREKTCDGNEKLGELLGIDNLHRIEIFDNSHLFGTFSVSGMVVFINGKALKKEYRKYKITTEKKDDYHMIKEVIYRRYFRVLKDDLEKPDLVIVDGGKIQVNAALEVINDLRLNIPVCGLKKDNKHKTSQLFFKNKNIDINHQSPLFYLLERIQEEVHRFTINYHKNIRSKGALESFLDNIEGIGPKRKIKLIKRFKSLSKIKEASFSELRKILPQKVVKNLKEYFNKNVK